MLRLRYLQLHNAEGWNSDRVSFAVARIRRESVEGTRTSNNLTKIENDRIFIKTFILRYT